MKANDLLLLVAGGFAVFYLLNKLKPAARAPVLAPSPGFSVAGQASGLPYDWVVPGSQQDQMLQAQFPSTAFGL